jgi:N-methylhydantoinase A
VLGRFGVPSLLGGEMPINFGRAESVLTRLGEEMSRFAGKRIDAEQAALGVIRVANANMESALRVVSVERGQDPRLFTLVSFGGAGGLHVCQLAAALRIPRVVVPRSPGTLSALGVLLGDVVKDYSRTVMMNASGLAVDKLERGFKALEQEALRDLKREGFDERSSKLTCSLAMRYTGQSFEIDVPLTKRFQSVFHNSHRERYGYADSSRAVEIVSLRLRAAGITEKPPIKRYKSGSSRPRSQSSARVFLESGARNVPVFPRDSLEPGTTLVGPAIVTEYSSTTLIPDRYHAQVDPWLFLLIKVPDTSGKSSRKT